jgi:hypothetical protein
MVSTDCGNTFQQVYFKGGETLATAPAFTSYYVPASSEWRTETIDLGAYLGFSQVLIAFRNKGHFGNVLYIDNVNISNDLNLQEVLAESVQIFPNPVEKGSNLNITGVTVPFALRIRDINGKIVHQQKCEASGISIPDYVSEGTYMVTIETETKIWNKPLVVTK